MKSAAPIFLLHPTKEESKDSSLGIGVRYNQGVVVVVTVVRVGRFLVEGQRETCVERTVARLVVVSGGLAAECRVRS